MTARREGYAGSYGPRRRAVIVVHKKKLSSASVINTRPPLGVSMVPKLLGGNSSRSCSLIYLFPLEEPSQRRETAGGAGPEADISATLPVPVEMDQKAEDG